MPSSCLVLLRADWERIAKEVPDEVARVKNNMLGQLRMSMDPAVEEIEQMQRAARPREEQIVISDVFFAAAAGDVGTVRNAIDSKAVDVNVIDWEGRTVLMIAAAAGSLPVVEYLLSERAALQTTDIYGKNALQNALRKKQIRVCEVLHKAGATLGWNQAESAAKLCEAARSGRLSDIQTLLKLGLPVDAGGCALPALDPGTSRFSPSTLSPALQFCSPRGGGIETRHRR